MAHGDPTYIGLKRSIIEAKKKAAVDSGMKKPLDTKPGSYIEREAEYITDAILECLTQANFSIKKLKAPVVVETIKSAEQAVNVELDTLLGEYQPVLKFLHKIADPLGLSKFVDKLEGEIKAVVMPLLQGGAKLPALDLKKENQDTLIVSDKFGGQNNFLESEGYVYIGEDPVTSEEFNVDDDEGRQEHTEVVLFKEDADKLK